MLPGSADVLDTYAWALFKTGRVDEAIEQLQLAISLPRPKAVYHYHLGQALAQAERYDEAMAQYRLGLRFAVNDTAMERQLQEAAASISSKTSTENAQ